MTASLLTLPDDPRFEALQIDWELGGYLDLRYPRSEWLRQFEDVLRAYYPYVSSRDLSLTARHYAPFPLSEGHDVP